MASSFSSRPLGGTMHQVTWAELVLVQDWTGQVKSVENWCVNKAKPKYIRGYESSRKQNYIQCLGPGLDWPNLPDKSCMLMSFTLFCHLTIYQMSQTLLYYQQSLVHNL